MNIARPSAPLGVKEAPCAALDVQRLRRDFPILSKKVYDKPLVYLDNAATTQKPQVVLDTLNTYYTAQNANIHRGIHFLSEEATAAYEEARAKLQRFLNAADAREIVFVRGATEAINLVAQSYGRTHVKHGDEILISEMEHHSNIVPWQILCEEKGAHLRVAPINDAGELLLEKFEKLITPHTKLIALAHVSNALGTVNPIQSLIEMAHRHNIPVLIDGAQAAPHLKVDVQKLDADFYVLSGHKIYGPTGIGVLYGKASLLEQMPPYQGGGEMISSVTFEKTLYNTIPFKFEAGTPNIAGAIGLGAALDYVCAVGIHAISEYECGLLNYATEVLSDIEGVRLIGTAKKKASVLSFILEGVHPHDVGTIIDREGVAIRTGHHCAQPVMQRFGVPATCRCSLAFYNTRDEIDILAKSLYKVKEVFR